MHLSQLVNLSSGENSCQLVNLLTGLLASFLVNWSAVLSLKKHPKLWRAANLFVNLQPV